MTVSRDRGEKRPWNSMDYAYSKNCESFCHFKNWSFQSFGLLNSAFVDVKSEISDRADFLLLGF
jgi:hypothetical protein